MWKLIYEIGGNMRVKSLYAYDIKNDIVYENSKEILTEANNLTQLSHIKPNCFLV